MDQLYSHQEISTQETKQYLTSVITLLWHSNMPPQNFGNAAIDQKEGRLPSPPHPPMAALTKQKAIYLKTECNLLLTILIRFTSTLNEWNRSIGYLQSCWPSIKDCEMSIGSKVLLRFTGLWKFSPCSSAIASSSVDRGVEGASSSSQISGRQVAGQRCQYESNSSRNRKKICARTCYMK